MANILSENYDRQDTSSKELLKEISVHVASQTPEEMARYVESLIPTARRISEVLGITDPKRERVIHGKIASRIIDEPVSYQLPPKLGSGSFKIYPMVGYLSALIKDRLKEFDQDPDALLRSYEEYCQRIHLQTAEAAEIYPDLAIKLALYEKLERKVLVGPTSGSFGIGMYQVVALLGRLTISQKDGSSTLLFARGYSPRAFPLFPSDSADSLPRAKWNLITKLHTDQSSMCQDDIPYPFRYACRETRNEEAFSLLLERFGGRGFFMPTNPLTTESVKKLARIVTGGLNNFSDLDESRRKILEDLGVLINDEHGTISVIRPLIEGIAGSAQSVIDLIERENSPLTIAFPSSAGPGLAGSLVRGNLSIIVAPDPSNRSWLEETGQCPFYSKPAVIYDGSQLPAANGMGSKLSPDHPTYLLASAKGDNVVIIETTDVLRQIARAICFWDIQRSKAKTLTDENLFPELASATPLAALIERKLRICSTTLEVKEFAESLSNVLNDFCIEPREFWSYATRGSRLRLEDVPAHVTNLSKLARIQGVRCDLRDNILSIFVEKLSENLQRESRIQSNEDPFDSDDSPLDGGIVIQITGLNSD